MTVTELIPAPIRSQPGESPHGESPDLRAHTSADARRREAWSAGRFGAIVHWGLPAIPAGYWDGRRVPGLAEWIQFHARIPFARYRALADAFDPTAFDARAWARLAADAGARYLVFTAKHHDGFAMYRSRHSAYNVCDATPFGRDPLAELADACRDHGLMLGIYYSHVIDWSDADAVGRRCNDWDFDPARGDFRRYWSRKAMPQLEELLTQYGDIGVMWFDMARGLPPACAGEASALVRRLQPKAVINSRLGAGGEADYQSMDDNYFNTHLPARDWETCATTNGTWGYARDAGPWKPAGSICEAIAYSVSRGGNYLLNLGPDATGRVPDEAARQFEAVGRWMRRAAPGIYGAGPAFLPTSFDWGHVTRRDQTLYLHVTDPSSTEVAIPGLRDAPRSAMDLASGERLDVGRDGRVALAPATDDAPRTVALRFDAPPAGPRRIVQTTGRALRLDVWSPGRLVDGVLRWDFDLVATGSYRVVLLSKQTSDHFEPRWFGAGLGGTLITAAGEQAFTLSEDGHEPYRIVHFWQLVRSEIGTLEAPAAGPNWLEIRDLPTCDSKWDQTAVNPVCVRLEPIVR